MKKTFKDPIETARAKKPGFYALFVHHLYKMLWAEKIISEKGCLSLALWIWFRCPLENIHEFQ